MSFYPTSFENKCKKYSKRFYRRSNSEEIADRAVAILHSYYKTTQRAFCEVLKLILLFPQAYMSQGYLGSKLCICREQFNRILNNNILPTGMLKVMRRGMKKTLIYQLPDWLNDSWVIHRILVAFSVYMSPAILAAYAARQKNVTQDNLYISKHTHSSYIVTATTATSGISGPFGRSSPPKSIENLLQTIISRLKPVGSLFANPESESDC